MANELKVVSTTTLGEWNNWAVSEVTADFTEHEIVLDDYGKVCAMAAMSYIWNLAQNTDSFNIGKADTSNLRDMVVRCASLKLNASADPQEVYFQMRSKKVGGDWKKEIEMVITTKGYESLLRNYGDGVTEVVGPMVVMEGDEFIPPEYIGFETKPPIIRPKFQSNKAKFVVYLLKLKGKKETYLISERESVQKNLKAHIRNSMLNETFGICAKKYDATSAQLEKIKQKKAEIMDAVNACKTVDEMLSCQLARPYISAAWLDSTEEMIVTKMIKNCVKKFPKQYNTIGRDSIRQLEIESDDSYKITQEEVSEHENSEPFVIDGTAEVVE